MSVGYAYNGEENSEIESRLKEMLQQIFPIKELCDYMSLFFGSCLVGIKKEDSKFNIGYGTGANGKTILQKLMSYVLGPYAGTVSSAIFTTKAANPDAPTPGLVAMMGKRFVYLSETQKGTEFNEALVKMITGGDDITVRRMYHEATVMKPEFKIFMVANDLPKFRGEEYSMQRRLAVIPFMSQFVDKVDPKNEGFFYPKNPQLDNWIKQLPVIQAFSRILIQQCLSYLDNETAMIPEIIQQHTRNYICDNDDFQMFIENCFEPSDDVVRDVFTVTEIIRHFIEYLKGIGKPVKGLNDNARYSPKYRNKIKDYFIEIPQKRMQTATGKSTLQRLLRGRKKICNHFYPLIIDRDDN
ncbi:hypothetical protein HDU76_006186 [Blyttiomyces sp. JEL0837]|nr:hypothetical protein HDU76_006186 [Blyttiomyces sp. JEL0837]